MKKILLIISVTLCSFLNTGGFVYAEDNVGWSIIPKGSAGAASTVGESPGHVWENYRAAAGTNAGNSFASGVFSWESIFSWLKYLAKTLSQIGLVVGAAMIIYAGYKYAVGVFTGDASKGGQDAIKGAIYGVIIVIFSYAIMKLLISTFL